jgi:DNA-binding NarL/FixJ family response regulator
MIPEGFGAQGGAPMIRVLVADDNAVVRMGVVSLLEASGEVEVVGQAANGQEAIELAGRRRPNVVLLDVRMPLLDGVAAAALLARSARVLMLTYAQDTEIVADALRAGATGYLVHGCFEPADLLLAVRATHAGEAALSPPAASAAVAALQAIPPAPAPDHADSGLSAREREVMDLIARGLSNHDIAAELVLSEKTVKNHVNHIYAKLAVRTRAEAIASWLGVAGDPADLGPVPAPDLGPRALRPAHGAP